MCEILTYEDIIALSDKKRFKVNDNLNETDFEFGLNEELFLKILFFSTICVFSILIFPTQSLAAEEVIEQAKKKIFSSPESSASSTSSTSGKGFGYTKTDYRDPAKKMFSSSSNSSNISKNNFGRKPLKGALPRKVIPEVIQDTIFNNTNASNASKIQYEVTDIKVKLPEIDLGNIFNFLFRRNKMKTAEAQIIQEMIPVVTVQKPGFRPIFRPIELRDLRGGIAGFLAAKLWDKFKNKAEKILTDKLEEKVGSAAEKKSWNSQFLSYLQNNPLVVIVIAAATLMYNKSDEVKEKLKQLSRTVLPPPLADVLVGKPKNRSFFNTLKEIFSNLISYKKPWLYLVLFITFIKFFHKILFKFWNREISGYEAVQNIVNTFVENMSSYRQELAKNYAAIGLLFEKELQDSKNQGARHMNDIQKEKLEIQENLKTCQASRENLEKNYIAVDKTCLSTVEELARVNTLRELQFQVLEEPNRADNAKLIGDGGVINQQSPAFQKRYDDLLAVNQKKLLQNYQEKKIPPVIDSLKIDPKKKKN